MRVREIYIGDFSNISAQLELYRRFSQYIGATQIISAIFRLYRLNDKKKRPFPNSLFPLFWKL
ncbi:hypothetical protein, partial [Bacillus cereus group sp. BfR-BA-01423]|uniref:hypothetical protein n=1 Tax=Bacillus cereus group sp. BfR-BA-01423 TaxID=2920340 RepID=UPI001F569C63